MQDQKVMKQMVEQFFYAASPPGSPQYDPTTQWNQVTLTCTILGCIWHEISTFERACILEYKRKIQINPNVAPSDTSIFVGNYTLRLFCEGNFVFETDNQQISETSTKIHSFSPASM
jgi:hypothetical protein